jgi:N-methylhydantoinase B/oxoprolinase/acetone carboxylase alpha subunit
LYFLLLFFQEGATFKSFLLVRKGIFQEEELINILMAPRKLPGSWGARSISNNISDLKAQIAANQKVNLNYLYKISRATIFKEQSLARFE